VNLDAMLLGVSLAVLIINLPFGFFRVRYKRFTRPWGRCIYIPILINIILRRFILHWDWDGVLYLFSAAILGHILGGLWGRHQQKKREAMSELSPES
jgi:hypothetical protein